ncbi:MAG: hypothetical protein A2508_08350 [Candidatus Lambdaproteobacteria bacterium RIFOXYD12_FULL_49_8]|uniref:Homocitrate synthase n=1 Tax=Candidatus Lambdaproteobacteria bacterium RIFOXYD2_FULL_50_16 TaxID=1817772 RepID=A0A1F6G8U0_9PROT|nr:MAG: hypothetical protein A2527_01480 [Candidatus Lambdaproteobacteria bacterium RIFOXYD2_FULL_50_16]OGG97630.1 MAG: hypothetical protein A2508_08350 [Candidatus Lambdaproteobacteria bacterium RIFOXYD12_FULL_49_8]
MIVDTTLRDGEQTPGVNFSTKEKLAIAIQLDQAGVACIEAGTPAMGRAEKQAIKEIIELGLNSQIVPWNRALERDVDHSLEIGAQWVHISLPVSSNLMFKKMGYQPNQILAQLERVGRYVVAAGAKLSVGAEDATRAEAEFLLDYGLLAQEIGAKRLRLCDTVGIMDPFSLKARLGDLIKKLQVPVEIHAHNDLGMATANALAAFDAGAKWIDTTVLGLGERAGNTPLEEIVLALKITRGVDVGVKLAKLAKLAALVSQAAGRPIPEGKSILGPKVFCHESGIHVDGVLKDPTNYEPFSPELVGASRSFLIGKHSGSKAVLYKLAELGLTLSQAKLGPLVRLILERAGRHKGGLSDDHIRHLALAQPKSSL